MYPSPDNPYTHERPRLISSFVRHDPPYPVNGLINPFSHPATTRNQSIDHSFHSPVSNYIEKTPYGSAHGPLEHSQEFMKPMRTQPNMTPFLQSINNNHSIPSMSRGNRPGHHRTGSHPLMMSNFSVGPSPNMTPTMQGQPGLGLPNFNRFPSQFTPSVTSDHHLSEMREDKMIKFLERQNAVIEKLAVRIQQEERNTIQREKRDLEFKLRNLENERMIRDQKEESMKQLTKIQAAQAQMEESMRSTKRDRRPSFVKREKSQSNLLETLGKMYLVQKLSSKPNQRSKSMANGLARNPTLAARRIDEEQDFNDEDQAYMPTKPIRLSKQNSFKVRRAGLTPLDLDELQKYNKNQNGDSDDDTGRRKKKGLKKEKSSRKLQQLDEQLEDEEEVKKKEAELKKQKEKKKKQAEGRLRATLWGITYSKLLFNEVKKLVDNKKANIQNKMSDNLMMNFEVAQTFMINCGDKFLRELVKESKNLELYNPKKSYSSGDLDTRMNFIFQKLKLFFDKLIVGTNKTNINNNFLRFMASLSEDSGVLPSNFMFDFELKRLQFTHYATLKLMTPQKSKMIIGCFMLLRVLVHKIILRPWTVLPGISKSSVKMNNLLTIASIMNHIVLDFYRGSVATHANNQAFLPVELKIKPKSVPLPALDTPADIDEDTAVNKKEEKSKEAEPISGLFTKNELKACFVDRKKLYDQLKALVDGWLEQMYNLVHDVYIATPKEERDNLGVPI